MTKLNIGCGKRDFGEGWHHIDKANYDHIIFHKVEKLFYDDNSVDTIYSSHLIGYFDRQEIIPIFTEWKRTLKPGGILRLAVPDFEAISELYTNKVIALENFLGPLYGKMIVNDKETIYHKTVYDFYSLTNLLRSVGFKDIKRYDFNKTEHSMFDDCSKAHFPHNEVAIKTGKFTADQTLISLNVECVK